MPAPHQLHPSADLKMKKSSTERRGQLGHSPTEHNIEMREASISSEHNGASVDLSARPSHIVEQTTHHTLRPAPMRPPRPAAAWGRPDYSDLEVCATAPKLFDDEKVPVPAVPFNKTHGGRSTGSPLSPCATDPVPAYSPNLAATQSNSALNAKGEYAEWDQRDMTPTKQEKRVCGTTMSKKKVSLIGVGVLAFVLIILATVLGITLTMNIVSRQKGKGIGSGRLLHDRTSLSAVNWTDLNGNDRSAVFYQDRSDAIMVALRDSVSNQWTQSNVTSAVLNTTGSSRLDVLSGTPIAAVTNRWQTSLYYLTTENKLAEIWSSNILGEIWNAGVLSKTLTPLTAANGSFLSAFWTICSNCTGSLYVAFQDDSGSIKMANLTKAWAFATPPSGLNPLLGTGLAVLPFTEEGGAGKYGADPGEVKLYSFDSTGLKESKLGHETNGTWESSIASSTFSSTIAADPSPALAASSFGDHGLTKSLVNYLAADGTILSYFYNGTGWTTGRPEIANGPQNITAIAATQNLRVYAASNGSIYELECDRSDPLKWTARSVVMSS